MPHLQSCEPHKPPPKQVGVNYWKLMRNVVSALPPLWYLDRVCDLHLSSQFPDNSQEGEAECGLKTPPELSSIFL